MTVPTVEQAVVRFDPLPGQLQFMKATEPEILYSGALGAGKTKVGLQKLLFLSQYYPGNECLIVRKTGSDLPSTTLRTLFEGDGPGTEVLPPGHIVQRHETKHYVVIRTNGAQPSRIWWTGMDRIMRLGGTQFGAVFFDECVEGELDDWVMLNGRLRHPNVPFHQLMGATNPGAPSHFLYDLFWKRGEERDPDTRQRLRFKVEANSLDNPHLPDSYKRRLNRFSGAHRDRFVLGKWVGFEGLVYGEFNPGVHVVPSFPVPREWRRLRAVDFGGGNPFSCSWYAQEPTTNTWFQYRQIYMTGRRVAVLGEQVRALSHGEAIEDTIADHDVSSCLELEAQGIGTTPARKDVDQGIEKVQSRLALRPAITEVPAGPGRALQFPDGAPGILFMEDALVEEDPVLLQAGKVPLRTTHEFGFYKWARSARGLAKDVPVKEHDHGLDELRYFLMHVDALDTMTWTTVDNGMGSTERLVEARTAAGIQVSTKQDRIEARRLRREGAKNP